MGDLLVYIFDGAFGAQRWIPWPHVTPTGHCNRVWASSPPVHILPFSALRPQKCWQSQINTLGVWTTHSLAKILQIRCSCPVNRFPGRDWNVFADFFFISFYFDFFLNLTEPKPQCRTNQKANWMFFFSLSPFFFLIEVFKLSKISHSQAFSGGECVSGNIVFARMRMCRPLIIWLSPASLRRRGFHSPPDAIYCQGPQIQIDPDTHADGVFF